MNNKLTILRSGQPPAMIEGEEIAGGAAGDEKRKYILRIIRAVNGEWFAAVAYESQWPHEPARYDLYHAADLRTLSVDLMSHNPLAHVVGYPRGKQFEHKQAALKTELRRRWDNLLTEVLARVPGGSEVPR